MSVWPYDSSEMASRIRDHEWGGTPLGPSEDWSERLKLIVEQVLASPLVSSIVCGPQRILIYNDAAARLYGARHPDALGRPVSDTFPEGWAVVAPFYERAFAGEAVRIAAQPLDTRGEGNAEADMFDALLLPVHEADGRVAYIHMTGNEVGAKVRAEAALRERNERQSFLLRLSDTVRPLADPAAIQGAAAHLLGEHLRVDRCAYGEIDDTQQFVTVHRDYHVAELPSVVGRYRIEDYGAQTGETLRRGDLFVLDDVLLDPLLSDEDVRSDYSDMRVRAAVVVPLVKSGRLVTLLTLQQSLPRAWSRSDLQLIEEVADRTWAAVERTRAEAAQRESEERFAQFAASSSDILWIRDAATLALEYVSPAFQRVYGTPPEPILGDPKHWAALIIPDDRDAALTHLERSRSGEVVTYEFRIQHPSDGSFRWIRNTDFPLHNEKGRVQRIGGIAQDMTEAKLAAEHQGVLLAELQHRVRNIMALIRAITARTGERAQSVAEYASLMEGRLMTFSRVQALLTRAANVGVSITDIVRDELKAQAGHEDQYALDGPNVVLAPKTAEVLTLAIHELTTNALKYGGLSVPNGHVAVYWATFEKRGLPWLGLDWIEDGAPARALSTPRQRGFGSELIEGRIPYELGGRGRVEIEPGGARCRLEFPLREGASILETDAPRRASVFGGTLDMIGEADLSGHRILVVEDDYFLAADTAHALRSVGAAVLGPCPTEEAARDEIEAVTPTGAVIDLNLGTGASFALAGELRARSVPFVMVTGYNAEVIPSEFEAYPRLQKPVQLREIVRALAAVLVGTAQPNSGRS